MTDKKGGEGIVTRHDLVQRALQLLTQPPERIQPKEAVRPQQASDQANTVHPGDWIEWQRAGTVQRGIVDFLHEDADGTTWAFVTIGESGAAVNLKYATLSTDVTNAQGG